jgi:hypothetical protein
MIHFTHSPLVFTLDNSISIYVPTVYQSHEPIPVDEVERYKSIVTERLTDFFGGVTETTGTGYFKHERGEVQAEKVFILTSFSDADSLNRNTLKLRTLSKLLAIALQQESVLLVVNGVAGFYEGTAERYDVERSTL